MTPVEKTIELLTKLQGTIVRDSEKEEAAYQKFFQYCDDATKDKAHEIKMAMRERAKLEAEIKEADSDIGEATVEIERLSKVLLQNNKKMKEATEVREMEAASFTASEQKLSDAMEMLERAVRILEKQMRKGSASFLQGQASEEYIQNVLMGLKTVIEAAGLPVKSRKTLQAFLQTQERSADSEGEGEGDDDAELGAPKEAAYTSKSGGLVDMMEDMHDQAQKQLRLIRDGERKAQHNYELLKQALEDEAEASGKAMNEEKATKAKRSEDKAAAEGDLAANNKQLKEGQKSLDETKGSCMQTAADHEASVAANKAELKAVTKAKQIIQASMGSSAKKMYLFLQTSSSSKAALRAKAAMTFAENKAVELVKRLAYKQHSAALTQLASRLAAVVRYGVASGDDPFVKVRGLITTMIERLEKELGEEAKQKAYCDAELKKTNMRHEELSDKSDGLKGNLDEMMSQTVSTKGQIQTLQSELAELAKLQGQMDDAREKSHDAYLSAKADLEQGLAGTRAAMRVLRDYYASKEEEAGAALVQQGASLSEEMHQPDPPAGHTKSSGAGGAIIGLLEVVESDIAKNLAQVESEEDNSQGEYEEGTQENKILKATKEKDVEYKNKELKAIEKNMVDQQTDYETTNSELAAVKEYLGKVKEECIAKPDSYEERKKRRQDEIKGLQEALEILEREGAFIQRRSH